MVDMDVANKIKAWRRELGLTQEAAAEALDVPVQTIRGREIGRFLPRHLKVLRLAMTQVAAEQQKPRRKRARCPEEAMG